MSRILITGGAGYIGSCFAWACRDANLPHAVVDDLTTGFRESLPPDTPFLRAKVSDRDAVAGLIAEHKLDSIVHFAGSISIEESVRDPQKYWRNNRDETQALLDIARSSGVSRLVFSSTAAVYGDAGSDPIPETRRPDPASPYGETKAAVEALLAIRAPDLQSVALRYFNVAGADPHLRSGLRAGGSGNLIKVCCDVALGRRPQLTLHGLDYPTPDGSCVRDYVHVADLVEAHLKALDYLAGGGPSVTLNCGYGRGFSVREVIAAFELETGRPLSIVPGPRRPGDVAKVISDAAKIRSVLGWRPRYEDLAEIVRSCLAWEGRLDALAMTART